MSKRYWLVKQEPGDFSWSQFALDGGAAWTGVRNFQARIHLRAMQPGDGVLFYHSGTGREIVGLALVAQAAYPDPTAETGDWCCVDLAPARAMKQPVSLATIKADPLLREMVLVRQSRLSVTPVTPEQFKRVLELSGTRL